MELYNWQHDNKPHDSFAAWLLISTLTHAEQEYAKTHGAEAARKKYFTDLAGPTQNWTACEMKLTINGVEVPFKETIDALSTRLDVEISKEALRLLKEQTSLSRIVRALEQAQFQLRDVLQQEFKALGLHLPEED